MTIPGVCDVLLRRKPIGNGWLPSLRREGNQCQLPIFYKISSYQKNTQMLFIKHIFQALRPLSLSLSLEEAAETLVLHLLLTVS